MVDDDKTTQKQAVEAVERAAEVAIKAVDDAASVAIEAIRGPQKCPDDACDRQKDHSGPHFALAKGPRTDLDAWNRAVYGLLEYAFDNDRVSGFDYDLWNQCCEPIFSRDRAPWPRDGVRAQLLLEKIQAATGAPTPPARAFGPIKCQLPPTGWACSRDPGHEGPCAASPAFKSVLCGARLATSSAPNAIRWSCTKPRGHEGHHEERKCARCSGPIEDSRPNSYNCRGCDQ